MGRSENRVENEKNKSFFGVFQDYGLTHKARLTEFITDKKCRASIGVSQINS